MENWSGLSISFDIMWIRTCISKFPYVYLIYTKVKGLEQCTVQTDFANLPRNYKILILKGVSVLPGFWFRYGKAFSMLQFFELNCYSLESKLNKLYGACYNGWFRWPLQKLKLSFQRWKHIPLDYYTVKKIK